MTWTDRQTDRKIKKIKKIKNWKKRNNPPGGGAMVP
jgi:hypothetical protein